MMKQQQNLLSTTQLSHAQSHLFKLLSSFILLTLGITLGIIASPFLTTISLPIRFTSLSTGPPPPPPPLPPSLPLPPPPLERIGIKRFIAPDGATHDMTDEELLWRASMTPRIEHYPYNRVPKVAFLFLIKWDLPLMPLWEKFFEGHHGLFSIYVHTSPFFDYASAAPEGSVFHGRQVPSKVVQWGQLNMLEAERRLLANALLDFSNQRFVLLSESCAPLFNFPTVYSYLINSTTSFVHTFDDPSPEGRGRYNPKMRPLITKEQWRKGSQWFEMDRAIAIEVVGDRTYYPVFEQHCKPPCYVDEHYIPTLVTRKFCAKNSNRSLTWVDWSQGGPHPARFQRNQVTVDLLRWMRDGNNCTYNGEPTRVCFLFARKFTPNSLTRFLRYAPKVMGFG